MLVIASDIHMTDRDSGDPVTDAELTSWLATVAARAQALGETPAQLRLVFLGDIVDLLRSSVWDDGREEPWRAHGEGFENFQHGGQEDAVTRAAEQTCARYSEFFQALAGLRAQGTTVDYLPGNHDFMVRVSPGARAVLQRHFGAADLTRTTLDLPDYQLHAEHGNRFDAYNLHAVGDSLWAFGDAVVIYLVNRLSLNVARALGITKPTHPLMRELAEIDNVEPSFVIPQFVAQILERNLTNPSERAKAEQAVRDTVVELLDIAYFADKRYKVGRYRRVLELLAKWDLAEMMLSIAELLDESDNLTGAAFRLHVDEHHGNPRHVVLGHTHQATVHPLVTYEKNRRQAFYLNTGTWRRVYLPARHVGPRDQFCSTRTGSWVEFFHDRDRRVRFRHVYERVG